MNRLRIPVSRRARKLKSIEGLGSGPEGRIEKMRTTVTALIRHERLEGSFRVLDESRGYVELLIQQACLYGPKHRETMEMAEFWLREKDLVQKLFKVLVPRFSQSAETCTEQYQLPTKYPENSQQVLLEIKGNPWPAVLEDAIDTRKWINNVLLEAARKNSESQVTKGLLGHSKVDSVENSMHDSAGGTAV